MVVEDKIQKLCCFYVSDFHLEMILIPYINKKIDEDFIIKTEKNLKDSIKILISRMNFKGEKKEKILNLGWDCENNNIIKSNSNIIIIGSKGYIESINNIIKQNDIKNVSVVDCYNLEDIQDKISIITKNYKNYLNTTRLE